MEGRGCGARQAAPFPRGALPRAPVWRALLGLDVPFLGSCPHQEQVLRFFVMLCFFLLFVLFLIMVGAVFYNLVSVNSLVVNNIASKSI